MSAINITSYNGSKLGLSTDKINKLLREALFNKHALPRGTRLLSGTILQWSTSSFTKVTPSGPGFHLKHRISKREYKVVLSKTYIRTTLLMLKYQGKVGGVQHAEVPALTWLVLYYDTRLEVRNVHESTTSPTNTPLWLLPRLSHEDHTISLTLIWASFISIQFKLSNNRAQLSK